MPPDIITTKRDTEIGRLLERVIRDHRKDISAFSKGWLDIFVANILLQIYYDNFIRNLLLINIEKYTVISIPNS
jgi:hypothetical protein